MIPRVSVWSAAARRRFAWAAAHTAPVESASKLAHSTRFAPPQPSDLKEAARSVYAAGSVLADGWAWV